MAPLQQALLEQWEALTGVPLAPWLPLATWLLGAGVLLAFAPRARRALLDALETLVASLLLLVLVGVILGLPFAAAFIAFKGVAFLVASLGASWRVPALWSRLAPAHGAKPTAAA